MLDRISWDPRICGGVACLARVRMPVVTVLKLLAAGVSEKEILSEYPYLTSEDIRTCLEYSVWLASEKVLPMAAAS